MRGKGWVKNVTKGVAVAANAARNKDDESKTGVMRERDVAWDATSYVTLGAM